MGKKVREIRISTILGKDTQVGGDFNAKGSARIDGHIEGNVSIEGTLVVGAAGSIRGNVKAEAAIIGGEVIGDVEAKKKVELIAAAKVIGDITTESIVIDENTVFQGRVNMNQETPAKKARISAARESKKSAKAALTEALREVREEAEKDEANTQEAED